MSEKLVSIIMPTYNSERFIKEAIESVINQTYQNWELLIVDDNSRDNSINIIKRFQQQDDRIKLFKLNKNSGPAIARNKAILQSKGEYIAFLDSDDIWKYDKLEKQIKYMQLNNILFSCTFYNKIDKNSNDLKRIIKYKKVADYEELLKNSPGNSTVIYNCNKLGKFYALDIKRRNDYVLWLDIIKKCDTLHCLNEVLSSHRIRSGSVSSNKFKLIKYHWFIYRKIESLSYGKSIKLVLYYCYKGVLRIYLDKKGELK